MNVSEFEFVTPNDLCIKDEIEFNYFDGTTLKIEADALQEDVYEIKCGTVMVSTHGNFTLVCAFCNEEFGDMPSFGTHMHSKHFCDNSEQIPSIETTQGEQSEEVNFTDDVKYPIESSSNEEIYVPDRNFLCETCNRRFQSSAALSSHETLHNPQPPDIEKECIKTKVLEARTNSNRSPVPEPPSDPNAFCDVCDRQYKSKAALRDHAARHGNSIPLALRDDPTYLICKFCNRKFSEAIERIEHEFGHPAGARYECAYCPKTFQNQYQRRTHLYTHTGERPYKCKMCPKAFTAAVNLLRHERDHLGIKPYFCEVCRKRFVRNWDRIIHLRSHTLERPYKCEHCDQAFITSSLLLIHMRRHTNTRTHKCDVCEKSFFRNDALKLHKLMHTNLRPFECDVCGNTFRAKSSLVTHLKVHAEPKEYLCNICGRKFFQSSSLTNHMKTHGAKNVVK